MRGKDGLTGTAGPKLKDRRHRSYDEGADEPGSLIEDEATDIEKETPSDDNEPVEGNEDEAGDEPSPFTE
jgi:hypothetical protein